ncbi:MAG: HD domain-containing protein [Clostridia bacterium]|nr:HD domain-containing protein [Clostridia bacterium]
MEISALFRFLAVAERLKCNTRHCDTTSGRRESVAEHCWRLALMAWLVRDEFPDLNMDRVIVMCLTHDLGEAITGDIPTFEKTKSDEQTEGDAVRALFSTLPDPQGSDLTSIFDEIDAQVTPEAKLFRALDKMEAVMQHNESDIATWLPLEYDLQLSYGKAETDVFPYTRALKDALNAWTRKKIAEETPESK